MTLTGDAKVEEKLTCGQENDIRYGKFSPEHLKTSKLGLENDMRNLGNFHQRLESVKNGTLMGLFCPKQKMYELKIDRGVMCHDNEK